MIKVRKQIIAVLILTLMGLNFFIPNVSQAGISTAKKALPSQSGLFSPIATKTTSSSTWEQLGGNPQHTGYVDDELSSSWQIKWIWNGPAGSGNEGPGIDHLAIPKAVQPIVGDGKLYLGHSDGVIRAISVDTGKQIWTSINLGAPIANTAVYDKETNSIYAATTNGRFWRLDAKDGKVVRSNRPGGEIWMAPLLVGNLVFIGTTSGILYAFDKISLQQAFPPYEAGSALVATPAYSGTHGGLIILLAEDKSVHCLQAYGLSRRWRTIVNGDVDPKRGRVFADTYPVVSEENDVVIIRSYLDWGKMWFPDGGAPETVEEIRSLLSKNPEYQSFFVIDLKSGQPRFVAPVMVGAIGNGGDFEAPPPQVVVKRLPGGEEVAYLLWRTKQACLSACDSREDTTLGEMDLRTGDIRFVQDYKNDGSMRFPTDEQSPLSMAGDVLFHAHWMLLGTVKITDRSGELGESYLNPIHTDEMPPVLNTMATGTCGKIGDHYCAMSMENPCDGFVIDPGFYVYIDSTCVYDRFWSTPVRSAVIDGGKIFWKTVDGAVIALGSGNQ
jgi:outer membrane protein assembly factor BamB